MTDDNGDPAGEAGVPGRHGAGLPLTRLQVLALAFFVVFAFVVLSVRTELQQRQIRSNSVRIAQTQYDQCQLRNQGTRRQNGLINAAIDAEKRKPKPDPKRIQDLTNFLGATPDCGSRP